MFVKLLNSSVLMSTSGCRLLYSKPPLHLLTNHNTKPNEPSTRRQLPQSIINARRFHSTAEEASAVRITAKGTMPQQQSTDDLLGTDSIVPVSMAHIRKTIRSGGFELSDGYSCLRTVCPACESTETPKSNAAAATSSSHRTTVSNDAAARNTVFINKTTGAFVCPTCQIVRSWSAMEACFQRPSGSTATRARREFDAVKEGFHKGKEPLTECSVDPNAEPIELLASDVVARVLKHLGLEVNEERDATILKLIYL